MVVVSRRRCRPAGRLETTDLGIDWRERKALLLCSVNACEIVRMDMKVGWSHLTSQIEIEEMCVFTCGDLFF